jgi:hypothetical protein
MILLENIKRIAEKATGWRRPEDPQALLRECKAQTYPFNDDASFPTIRDGPLLSTSAPSGCQSASTPQPYLKSCLRAEAGEARGATASTTMPIIIRAPMKFSPSRGAAVACDSEEKKDALSL